MKKQTAEKLFEKAWAERPQNPDRDKFYALKSTLLYHFEDLMQTGLVGVEFKPAPLENQGVLDYGYSILVWPLKNVSAGKLSVMQPDFPQYQMLLYLNPREPGATWGHGEYRVGFIYDRREALWKVRSGKGEVTYDAFLEMLGNLLSLPGRAGP